MDLVFDEGMGVVCRPERGAEALLSCSLQFPSRPSDQPRADGPPGSKEVQRAGLKRGSSIDLDFYTVPANTGEEPLEKHYVSSRSAARKASSYSWRGTPRNGFVPIQCRPYQIRAAGKSALCRVLEST